MNKKLNTALFFLAATVVNMTIVLLLALLLFVPYALWLAPILPPVANLFALVVVVIGSMAGSFPIYRKLVDLFQKKVDMEKYFDPIVKPSRRNRR